jgi:diguanylate cyclase (GGDEF)-like protein
LLIDRLGQALSLGARNHEFGALLMLDLDHFKKLNDTHGHDVGDRLLTEVAHRLTRHVRQADTVSRLGGDEFVVMVEGLGKDERAAANQAEQIAEQIRDALNLPYELGELISNYHSTPSIGLTLFRGVDDSVEVLFKQADVALYQAKEAGRNVVRFFNPAMQAAIDSRSALETAVSPAEFIPLAEETGLIVELGQWVLDSACRQLKQWEGDARNGSLPIAVNVSARQFHLPDFVERVKRSLALSGANPARLKLELTESLLLENVDGVIARMAQLHQLGVRFSLDDFGTGYSSLSYLKRLPLDQIKIDQSFVRDLPGDPNDAAIVRAIITMGQSLGLNVIAEGVETREQQAFLSLHGCVCYQGYLFARPLPIEDW